MSDVPRTDVGAAQVAVCEAVPDFYTVAAREVLARAVGGYLYPRSEEHTSELQSLMRTSYAGFCLKKKNKSDKNLENASIKHIILAAYHYIRQSNIRRKEETQYHTESILSLKITLYDN